MMGEENKVSSVQETGGGKRIAPAEKSRSAGKTAGLVVGIVLGVLVLGYGAACAAAQMVYGHAALPNTTVLGLDVSGMSAQEAEQLWQEKGAAALESTAIDLTRDGQTVGSVTLAELGVTVKPLYISRAAGCDSASDHPLTVVESGWELLRSYLRPTDVTPQLDVDGAKLTDTCETLADTLDCTLVDGSYRLENGQGLYITKPRDGEKLDGGALRTLLEQRLAARDLSPAECVYRERQAAALDDHVAHLAGHAVGTVVDLAVMDDASAHACAQGDGDEALAVAARAHQELGQGGAVGIVFNVKRDAEIAVEQLAQGHVAQRQVAGIIDRAGADLHRTGDAYAHGGHVADGDVHRVGQLLHQGGHRPGQSVVVRDGCHLHLLGGQQDAVLIHQAGLQVRAADVYANILHGQLAPFPWSMASTLLSNWVTKSRAAL